MNTDNIDEQNQQNNQLELEEQFLFSENPEEKSEASVQDIKELSKTLQTNNDNQNLCRICFSEQST